MSPDTILLTDGSLDWSLGVNSIKTPTIVSKLNPAGLARNELAWLDNGTVRTGAIGPRNGWLRIGPIPRISTYQGSFIYAPLGANPYVIAVIGGHVLAFDPDAPGGAIDLSVKFGLILPITERVYFCQAEQFLIIQPGDYGDKTKHLDAGGNYGTPPLFWDGTTLRQSVGITNTAATPASPPHTNEIPAATAMCYYMVRVWYAQGRTVSAGDIVGGANAYPAPGPPYYHGTDSVLCVTENPFIVGGDGFTVPTQAGDIRGLSYNGNLNTQLGEGNLYIGTREEIYQLQVPVTRTDWIAATSNNQPLMTPAVIGSGWVNDRSIVQVNSDLFFQTIEPAIRSLALAIRNFGQWGNVAISVNEYRLLQFNDRSLLRFASGINFDNRLLQTALPYQCPVGVAHKGIAPLNFDVISSLQGQVTASTGVITSFPAWEGLWEGINILELLEADFGGLQRAFAVVWSDINQQIEFWEITNYANRDDQDNRITWFFETPAWTFGKEFGLKELETLEMWLQNIRGECEITVEYRPDSYACYEPWTKFKVCAARNEKEVLNPANPYPTQYGPGYVATLTLPHPPQTRCANFTTRPIYMGYQFQFRVTVKGWLQIKGFFAYGSPRMRETYQANVCSGNMVGGTALGLAGPPVPPPVLPPIPIQPVPPKPPPVVPRLVILPDGAGGFWRVIVDSIGDVGTQSDPGPQTPDVILADGFGGFWKLIADTSGDRGTESVPGPATVPPVIADGVGGNWQLVVDVNGNVGAMSV